MRLLGLLASLFFAFSFSVLADEGWIQDFDAAKAKAEKDGKDVLIDFTGSDWCGWCIKLHKEVFEQTGFQTEAPKQFVLLELDFPRTKPQDEKIKKQNAELAKRFSIEGYPSVILTDSKGRAYARTGYQAGGDQKYLELLAKLKATKTHRDELFAQADKSTGTEKAQLLDKALDELNKSGALIGYDDMTQQIIASDPDNKAGLKAKYESYKLLDTVNQKMSQNDPDGALKLVEGFMKEYTLTNTLKQQLWFMKAVALNAKEDEVNAMAALKTAYDADPTSEHGERIAQIMESVKKQKEQEKTAPKDPAKTPDKTPAKP